MSITYTSAIVVVLAQVLPWLGIDVGSEQLTTTITTLLTVGAGLWIMWRRFSKGDITIAGKRK